MKTIRRPISILLAILMVVGMFTMVPITASAAPPESGSSGSMETGTTVTPSAATWTFKLNSNFSGEWNADTDVVSEQPIELNLAEGDYEFQIVAYEDGNLSSYRGNAQAGSFTETYSQTMYDNGGNAKFKATGGKYVLNYDGGTGLLTIKPVYVAEIDGTYYKTLEAAIAAISTVTPEYHSKSGLTINKYKANGSIKLLADCAGNGIVIDSGSGLTIDFDGHTYTVDGDLVGSNGTESLGFQLKKNSDVTFENGTITSKKAKILVQNYSNLGLYGMTLTLNNTSYNGAYTLSNNNGNAGIHNTTINANPTPGSFAFDVCRYSSYPSVYVEVTGEKSVINGNVEISASNGDPQFGFYLTLGGGTMNGNIVVDPSAQTAIEDYPGKAVVTKDNTFTQTAPEGFKWVDNGQGGSTLVALPYAAKIDKTKYRTLEEAFAAAQDGDTITLLDDCTGNGIKVPQGKFNNKGLTVDFVDYTYTIDGETVGSTGTETNGFQLLKDNKITFKGGTIYSEKAKILVQNYSDLTLLGMTLTLDNQNYTSAYTLSNNNGDVVIDSTTINANTAGGFAFDVCRYSSYPSVHVTVTGDSKINGDVEVYASKKDPKDGFSLNLNGGTMSGDIIVTPSAAAAMANTPDKASVNKQNTFTQDPAEGYKWVDNGDGTSTLAVANYVAQVGDVKYESLEEAIAAISTVTSEYHSKSGLTINKYKADGSIKLLADCAGNGIAIASGSNLTIDFDTHTYTVDGDLVGSNGTETIGFQLLKDSTVKFENGTITSDKAQMIVQNYSNLTLNNMVLDGTNMAGDGNYVLSNNNGNVVINDTTIDAREGCIAFDVCRYSSYKSVNVTVTGDSKINGDVEIFASKNDPKDGFSLNLNGGTMSGDIIVTPSAAAAMANTPDKASVNKQNTFTQDPAEGYKWVDNGDGTSTLAVANYVAQVGTTKYETLQDALDVVPNGGTVTVLKDITTTGNIFADGYVSGGNRTYTVDLGDNTVSGGTFVVADGNTVTFTNGTIESASYAIQNTATAIIDDTATVTSTATNASAVYGAAGSTTIIDGTVEGNKYGVIVRGGTLDVAGTVTATDTGIDAIEGGVANINDGADVSGKFAVVAHKDSVINVEDGAEITGTSHAISGNGKAADGPYTINVTGGTLTATEGAGIYNPNAQGTLNISGGTVTGTTAVIAGENATTSISGGTFNTPVPENYCAEGYVPKDNGDGTYTVEEEVKDLFVGYGLTLHGDIGLIFYLDPAAAGLTADEVESVSVTFQFDKRVVTVEDYDVEGGYIKVTCYVPAAYMAHTVNAGAVKINGVLQDETDSSSVQDYAERVIAEPTLIVAAANSQKAIDLMQEMLNYGAKAHAVFKTQMLDQVSHYHTIAGYTMDPVDSDDIAGAIEGEATDMSTVHPEANAEFYTPSVIYLSATTLRMVFEVPGGSSIGVGEGEGKYSGSQSNWYYWVDKTNIPANELQEQQTFTVGNATFNYSVLDYAKAVLDGNTSPDAKALASSLYLYNQAAIEFFTR